MYTVSFQGTKLPQLDVCICWNAVGRAAFHEGGEQHFESKDVSLEDSRILSLRTAESRKREAAHARAASVSYCWNRQYGRLVYSSLDSKECSRHGTSIGKDGIKQVYVAVKR